MVVRKRDESRAYTDLRQCGDYRPLNLHAELDRYRLPPIEDVFQDLQGAVIFTKLDFRSGYHQIPVAEEDKCKNAFWGAHRQLWEWNVVPFGLNNAPPFFQRLMDKVLAGLPFARCYIDDIIIWSKSFAEHLTHLEVVFSRLRAWGLKIHLGKCLFGADEVDLLGHRVNAYGIKPQMEKTRAIRDMQTPSDLSSLRALLGLFSYYRKYVPHFSVIAAPLNKLLKKDAPWKWGEQEATAVHKLKQLLCFEPVL